MGRMADLSKNKYPSLAMINDSDGYELCNNCGTGVREVAVEWLKK